MQQQRGLQMLRHFVNELRDRLGGIGATPDLNDFGCALKLVRELLNLFGERR